MRFQGRARHCHESGTLGKEELTEHGVALKDGAGRDLGQRRLDAILSTNSDAQKDTRLIGRLSGLDDDIHMVELGHKRLQK